MEDEDKYSRLKRAKEEMQRKVDEHEKRSRANQGKHPADFKFTLKYAAPLFAFAVVSYLISFSYVKMASRRNTRLAGGPDAAASADHVLNSRVEDNGELLMEESDAKWRTS